MQSDLIDLCNMFLVPTSILFAAIGIATTEPLKALISALGAVISGLWFYQIFYWAGSIELKPSEQVTGFGLAAIFIAASTVSTIVHIRRWQNERQISTRG